MLTTEQAAILKADINGDPALASTPNNQDGAFALADIYNLPAVPEFTVWKTNVRIGDAGKAFNGVELAGLTAASQVRLTTIAHFFFEGVNPSLPDMREMFDNIFTGPGGVTTRPKLLALWKRPASRIEKLFAGLPGSGTNADPATMTFEGNISLNDVFEARR